VSEVKLPKSELFCRTLQRIICWILNGVLNAGTLRDFNDIRPFN